MNRSNDLVTICDYSELSALLEMTTLHKELAALKQAMENRDPSTGAQIFMIKHPDGSGTMQKATIMLGQSANKTVVCTREEWNARMQKEASTK